ncbi:hypothetical protein HOG98_05580 [bacterium]|jgi:putative SOS response-associated peptidase YedK|nr:hypothetical protein [bacterium]
MCYSALVEKDLEKITRELGFTNILETLAFLEENKKYPENNRIYPKWMAPIIHQDKDKTSINWMQYSTFVPDYIPEKDAKKLTTFNVRKDSLTKPFWSSCFKKNHGVLLLNGFSEWVPVKNLIDNKVCSLMEVQKLFSNQAYDRKQRILKANKPYKPTATELKHPLQRQIVIDFYSDEPFFVPVIFNQKGNDFGFAIVTEDPTPDILALGHDRKPVFLDKIQISDWINIDFESVGDFFKQIDIQLKVKLAA